MDSYLQSPMNNSRKYLAIAYRNDSSQSKYRNAVLLKGSENMSQYSWWSGSLSPLAQAKLRESEGKGESQKVALVIGVTGIVGNSLAEILPRSDTPGGPWKVYGVGRRPRPNWSVESLVEYIQCDCLDREQTLEKLSGLADVTHLFWVTWVNRESEEENCVENERMLRNVLDAIVPNAKSLEHICLQTGAKHYLGPFDAVSSKRVYQPHEPPFHEGMPRLPVPIFYHNLEDTIFEYTSKAEGITWSIHRPTHIFGFSPWSLMNIIGTLCAYAAICKHEGLEFKFPGNKFAWEGFMDASDANLIAEQQIWAAITPQGKNQAFNCANGDVFKWKMLWEIIASKFGLEVPSYDGEGFNLAEAMKDKGATWETIVRENRLEPTKANEVGAWWFADFALNLPMELVHSMNKSKEHGFFGFRNTVVTVGEWIDKIKSANIVP